MATKPGPVIAIGLADGDELWNAGAACRYLGIAPSTFEAYEARRAQYAHPLPEPEQDPVALLVSDPQEAARVRALLAMVASARKTPKTWRKSAIVDWDSRRPRR